MNHNYSYLNTAKLFTKWFGKKMQFELLYRASRDGWTNTNFHSNCDNKGNTLVLIKSEFGKLFGGYANQPWDSKSGWI